MKTIVIGLLQSIGGWLVVAAAISWLMQVQFNAPFTATIGIALFGGAFIWIAIGLFASAFRVWRERAAILDGASGEKPVDGEYVVLVGRMESIGGTTLRAPLDDSPCVMYRYNIVYDAGQGRRRSVGSMARGVALAPSHIVTKSGGWKLLAVPDLAGKAPTNASAERLERFAQYVRRTTFIQADKSANELLRQWADADGAYRSDVAFGPLDGADMRYWQPQQEHVPPGEQVCVFGLFSQEKGGIVPSARWPARLMCGDSAEVAETLLSQVKTRTTIGVLILAALVAVVAFNT
jgi:hypothetical protein